MERWEGGVVVGEGAVREWRGAQSSRGRRRGGGVRV